MIENLQIETESSVIQCFVETLKTEKVTSGRSAPVIRIAVVYTAQVPWRL